MTKYKNKYRIESTRAQWWDYGWNGAYFITICTKNREHFFGEIADGKMNFSEIGRSANTCWFEIPNHFPFVKLGEFVVMPNHIHGIVIIDKQDGDNGNNGDGDNNGNGNNVETQNFASLHPTPHPHPTPNRTTPPSDIKPDKNQPSKNHFGPQSKNLASIVRGYKIGVTKNARLSNPDFGWQPRFHDHIIRNDDEYNRIKNHIITNPKNWNSDKFNG